MYDRETVKKICENIELRCKGKSGVVGISGPQGSGKSTIAIDIQSSFSEVGISCVILSLDDFYYSRKDRIILAKEIHPLLSTRGVPGTHEADWLYRVISQILLNEDRVKWPIFSKAADDRMHEMHEFVPNHHGPTVILLEGWCVGCLPTTIEPPMNLLESEEDPTGTWRKYVNNQIRNNYMRIWNLIDVFIYIQVPGWDYVRIWRGVQAQSNHETHLDLDRFLQFFERISREMMHESGRIMTHIVIKMCSDHSIEKLHLQ